MLLFTKHGVFYEFIPTEEYGKENPIVLTLNEVEIDKDYVIVITNNSGLRRYVLGDTIKFTTLNPWRIKISGIEYSIKDITHKSDNTGYDHSVFNISKIQR